MGLRLWLFWLCQLLGERGAVIPNLLFYLLTWLPPQQSTSDTCCFSWSCAHGPSLLVVTSSSSFASSFFLSSLYPNQVTPNPPTSSVIGCSQSYLTNSLRNKICTTKACKSENSLVDLDLQVQLSIITHNNKSNLYSSGLN